jgi:transcriptional regulator GlxA family with amidase domain
MSPPQRRPLRAASAPTRTVVLVAFPGVQLLDVAGPADVFGLANTLAGAPHYRLRLVSSAGGGVRCTSGISLETEALRAVPAAAVDTLIVAGGEFHGLVAAIADAPLAAWVQRAAASSRRFGSVCSGAFALAEWGLLQGRRATTHWSATTTMRRRYAQTTVEPEAIYVQDGPLWTSGGVTTGIDMCLAMVEQDHGRALAALVAKQLILPSRRLGNQSQFSSTLHAQSGRYAELVDWMAGHLRRSLDVDELAARAAQTPRSFHRHFQAETGQTPAAFVEQLRLQAAREQLEAGATLKRAAQTAGFSSDEHLVRAFTRRVGMTPAQYRLMHAATTPVQSPS